MKNSKTNTLVVCGMLAAMAFGLTALTHSIPLSPLSFLNYDAKDVVIVIGGFMFGPMPVVLMSIAVSLIEMISISSTGFIGFAMNVLSTLSFALTASIIYKQNRSLKGAVIALVSGTLAVSAVMLLWNYLITPLYMEITREAIAPMLIPTFLPYNLLKAGLNSTLAMLIYKPVSKVLRAAHLLPNNSGSLNKKTTVWVYAASALLLAALVLLALWFIGVFN